MTDAATTAERAAADLADPKTREEAAKDVRSVASELGGKAQTTADTVRRRVSDGADAARDWAADQSDVLRDTVQTKPFIAVGVSAASAFAAGLVLGVLLTRR